MEVQALTKFNRMSPKKVREVARTLKGKLAQDALEELTFIPRKSARLIAKTLKSAIANAENNHNLPSHNLYISGVIIEEGVTMKRFKPAARGSAKPIAKRTSHIRVILTNEL